jgi:Kef-type K+ transport system membrane component KefB
MILHCQTFLSEVINIWANLKPNFRIFLGGGELDTERLMKHRKSNFHDSIVLVQK